MPRNLHSFCASNLHTCPQSCTVGHAFPGKAVPHLAYWNGMVEIKTRGPRWNNAERQSARRVTCRLSHVRESKQRHGFRSSKTSPLVPTFIVSPPVYSHTAFLDDFFWRSFPYTQAEATHVFRTRGEISPLSKATARVGAAHQHMLPDSVCQTLVVCEREPDVPSPLHGGCTRQSSTILR